MSSAIELDGYCCKINSVFPEKQNKILLKVQMALWGSCFIS